MRGQETLGVGRPNNGANPPAVLGDNLAAAVALVEEHLGGRVIEPIYPCRRCAQATDPGHVLCSDCTRQKRLQAHNQRSTT